MELVVVERTFEEPVEFNSIVQAEQRAHWCLELHNVRYVQSYFSADRRRMICIYEAPDAESVRTVNATAKVSFDRVWSASLMVAPAKD
jgi:hypothetical protein